MRVVRLLYGSVSLWLLLANLHPGVNATLPFSFDLSSEGSVCSVSARLLSASSASSPAAPDLHVQLDAWGDDSIRIRVSPDAVFIPPVQALKPFAPPLSSPSSCWRGDSESAGALTNGNLQVSVAADGSFTATRLSDSLTLVQTAPPSFTAYSMPAALPSPYSLYTLSINYDHAPGLVYGLGEHQYPADRTVLPYTNFSYLFEQSQQYSHSRGGAIFMPWYVSQRGYGVLMNQAGYGSIAIGNDSAAWTFNATHQLDLFITTSSQSSTAPTPYAELMLRFSAATGRSNPMPHWASGFWQSKDRYRTQQEIVSVAEGLHNRSLPTSVMVIDYLHWPQYGDWTFVNACWPDPTGMVKELRSYDMRTMVSIWPILVQPSVHFKAMNESGLLTKGPDGQTLGELGGTFLPDPFNPSARQFVWEAIIAGYLQHGITLFWLDESEPDFSIPGSQYWMGHSDREVALSWPVQYQKSIFEGSLAAGLPLDEVVILSRSAWFGHAAMNVVTWSGDVFSTFDALYHQILIVQNSQLSGIYWWASDIGGYANGNVADPQFQELLVRWFQFSALTPIFRLHGHRQPDEQPSDQCGGSGGLNEVWTFLHSDLIVHVMALRESLRSYVEQHLLVTSQTGVPLVTPMFFHFADAECYAAQDQYVFGTDYVVAPVYEYQATSRRVYLPALDPQEVWLHVYTGVPYVGGQWHDVATTLADFPLFHKRASQAQSSMA